MVLYGTLFCLLIALPAWWLGHYFPLLGASVLGITFGMVIAVFLPPKNVLSSGIRFASRKLLQAAIILLGFEMQFVRIIEVGGQSLTVMFFTLTTTLLVAYFIGRFLRLPMELITLIGVGTSICGGSAIAATAPIIRAKEENVAHAISTIFLFNILAIWIFPPIGRFLHLGDIGFGMWAGTAINDTSSVVAAASSWSVLAKNNTALVFSTIVKLTRTLLIIPIALILSFWTLRKNKGNSEKKNNLSGNQVSFHFAKVFPWFVLGFLAAALANSFFGIPRDYSQALVTLGKFFIVMAMVAIGLSTHLKSLINNGWKPIFLGLCCWLTIAIISLMVQKAMRVW